MLDRWIDLKNNVVNEININKPLDSIIDPETNFLMGYFTEFEFNRCIPSDNKLSSYNLNIRSILKIYLKCGNFWNGYNIILPSYLMPKLGLPSIINHYTIVYVTLMYIDKTVWECGVSKFSDRINYQNQMPSKLI